VREEDGACLLAQVLKEALDAGAYIACAGPLAHALPGEVAGAVLEIRGKDLVARLEIERSGGHIHACRRVRNEGEVVRGRADERPELGARLCEEIGYAALDELHRLALELALPFLVALEDGTRARAERAVVQVDDVPVEEEELSERRYGIETFAV
jgi:hypothetical protein